MSKRVRIIGAGITGLTLGLLTARAGMQTEIVDPQLRPGERAGLMAVPAGLPQELQYHHVWRWHGMAGLQAYADQVRRGQQFVLAAAEDAGLAVARADQTTLTADGKEAFWLRFEAQAMRGAGLPVSFTDETGLPVAVRPMLLVPDQPVLDPVGYRDALLTGAIEAGAMVTDRPGAADPDWLVSTTAEPAFDRVLLAPRLRHHEWSWLELACDETAALPGRSSTDLDQGGRIWARPPSSAGAAQARPGSRLWFGSRGDDGRARAASWFPEAEVVDAWSSRTSAALDAIPFVGCAARPSERRLVACGFDAWELTLGTAAAMQLAAVLGGDEAAVLPWQPMRLPRPSGVVRAAWSRARHGLRISPVSPFPRRP